MPQKQLPRFVIYQPNDKEFQICLEVRNVFFRWCSIYPPTLDVRFPSEVTRIEDMPIKNRPKKRIIDDGTYSINKTDTKNSAQEKVVNGIENESLSFILNGKILKGRFAFKRNKNYTILQKFKDKYAKEEDVLSRVEPRPSLNK